MTSSPSRAGLVLAIFLRILLLGLLAFALLHQDWDRFADKAMAARAATYPLAALIVPVWWLIRRRPAFPYDVDALLMLPFIIDVGGNALDLYDRIVWFDDACHFANWMLLAGAIGCALRRTAVGAAAAGGLVIGFGAVTAILWELAEYQSFLLGTHEVVTIYRDTLGDEALGLSGATVAGLLTALVIRHAGATRGP